jgi:hypothetical protein
MVDMAQNDQIIGSFLRNMEYLGDAFAIPDVDGLNRDLTSALASCWRTGYDDQLVPFGWGFPWRARIARE